MKTTSLASMFTFARSAVVGVVMVSAAGCDLPCRSDDDCFGTTPVCDVEKCGCAVDETCSCTSRCTGEADCAEGFSCNSLGFCEVDEGVTDPDCN